MRKWRFIAGLEESSKPSPSEILSEGSSTYKKDETSQKFDFSKKRYESQEALIKAIEAKGKKNVTLAKGKEGLEDIKALGLKKCANVVDSGKNVFQVFCDEDGHLWFIGGSDSGEIKQTTLTMPDLRKFHSTADDVKMTDTKEERAAAKEATKD